MLQETGINFPPFEQRMERDFNAWKDHMHEKKVFPLPHGTLSSAKVAGEGPAVKMSKGYSEGTEKLLVSAAAGEGAAGQLVRSHSVAY